MSCAETPLPTSPGSAPTMFEDIAGLSKLRTAMRFRGGGFWARSGGTMNRKAASADKVVRQESLMKGASRTPGGGG